MKRKIRLFKNDPFGIKEIFFRLQLDKCMKERVKVRTNALKFYLNTINKIGVPRNDKEMLMLKTLLRNYDERISEFEEDLRYARMYIQEEKENKNE